MNLDMLKCLLHMWVEKMVEDLEKELPAKNPKTVTPDLLRKAVSLLDESKNQKEPIRTKLTKDELKKQRKREWYLKNKDKQREYMKKYHERKKKEKELQEIEELRKRFKLVNL